MRKLLGIIILLRIFHPAAGSAAPLPHQSVPLQSVPLFLQRAIITAEDKRFFEHHGTDSKALLHAAWQNLLSLRIVRGGSTITEQLVRLENNYPRTVRGRLQATLAARELEKHASKDQILERYLNLVTYPSNAKGVAEAARLLFDRDLSTLSQKEMLALAVLIRSPSGLDPRKNERGLERRVRWLAERMAEEDLLTPQEQGAITKEPLAIILREDGVRDVAGLRAAKKMTDPVFEQRCKDLLRTRIARLRGRSVHDGALLALDNQTGEIIASVSVSEEFPSIDAVRVPRQPGSALKPFLYALALERGWTPQTIIEDSPLLIPVGSGVHRFRNYSGEFFGPITLTEALGSSLNIPAVRTIQMVGIQSFLERLHALGFRSLTLDTSHYGEGLALGNGEVSLFELVRGYFALAHHGEFRDLPTGDGLPRAQVISTDAADKITRILMNPDARRHEFGVGGLLAFPIETAVKTGTSNDHHDAWAVGYSARFTVGAWLGNLDRSAMKEVSGSRGPAWVLRAAFAELERRGDPKELLVAPNSPIQREPLERIAVPISPPHILSPTPNMVIRRDPRIPDELEALAFEVDGTDSPIEWLVDGVIAGNSHQPHGKLLWKITPGPHIVAAKLLEGESVDLTPVEILVR